MHDIVYHNKETILSYFRNMSKWLKRFMHTLTRQIFMLSIQLFWERLSEAVHATIPKLWVVWSSLFFKEISKNGTRGHGCMFENDKGKQSRFNSCIQLGTVHWLYSILPFGIVVCTFFSTTFLEIAVSPHLSAPTDWYLARGLILFFLYMPNNPSDILTFLTRSLYNLGF